MKNPIIMWLIKLVPAIVLIQTLFFKFTASPESVYIFSTLGMEPWGRILSGIFELLAAVCLIIPAFNVYGAILASGVMAGAIVSHITVLGIEVMGDGGLLFILALVVLIFSLLIIYIERKKLRELPLVGKLFV